MKLRLNVDILCSLCNKPVPGEAYIWTDGGWDTKTHLDRAHPLDPFAGTISNNGGGGNRFTCAECNKTLMVVLAEEP